MKACGRSVIFVDYRAGSHELVAPLKALGLPVEETTLDAGDVAFSGRGEKGKEVLVGIEYKRLSDLISSLRTERLQGHQLVAMSEAGFDYSWLLIEGELLYDSRGRLQRRTSRRDVQPLASLRDFRSPEESQS